MLWHCTPVGKKTISFAVVALAALAAFVLLCSPTYDMARVHPSIRILQQPFRSVTADYYLDGGSIGMDITDRDGRRLKLAIPIYDGPGDPRTYHRLFLGARHSSYTGAVEVAFTEDTRRFLCDIISRQAVPGPDRDSALIALRGTPLDYADVYSRVLLRRVTQR